MADRTTTTAAVTTTTATTSTTFAPIVAHGLFLLLLLHLDVPLENVFGERFERLPERKSVHVRERDGRVDHSFVDDF